MVRAALAACLAFAAAAPAAAQPMDVQEARRRAAEELRCLDRVVRQLSETVDLLRDAEAQLEAESAELRQHAAQAVEALEDRLDDLSDALKECLPQTSRAPAVRTIVQERTGTEAAVGEVNDATVVVDRRRRLAPGVRVQVGERVDGTGRLPAPTLRRALDAIGDRVGACYESYLERGALEQGRVILGFTVDARGATTRVRTEGATFGDARFERCVAAAGRTLRIGQAPSGGAVGYAYTLTFGPE